MVKKKTKRQVQKQKRVVLEIAFVVVLFIALVGGFLLIKNTRRADYIVQTNAFFAPFEFYKNREIVGVDVEIIKRVAEKTGKEIEISDVEFDVIIDNVAAGKIADAGAAGLTITPARAEKVNFSIPYYNSVQYIIYNKNNNVTLRNGHVTWDMLSGATIGTQTGSTGYLFAADEVESGVLAGSKTTLKGFESHQLAADAISANLIDFAIADELAAKFIVSKNENLLAAPLYYAGEIIADDYPTEEAYAIAVNKDRTELLESFNEVLQEMIQSGEINKLILKYMGLEDE